MVIRKVNKYISGLFVLLSLMAMLLPFIPAASKPKADSNPASWILCMSNTGTKLYNAAETDSVPYALRSKSNNVQASSVDGFLNTILTTSGFNFDKVNKHILGRSIYNYDLAKQAKEQLKEQKTKKKLVPNKRAKEVNPFDRFGMAGLTWSSYSGEWKYYEVNACSSSNPISKTDYGKYYPKRKEPKATYSETANSMDPRVIQFERGSTSAWLTAFNDLFANMLFNVAKFVVTITIALISFSFRDILSVFNVAAAQGGMPGLFKNFYTGIFQPFVVIMMVFTGIYVFVNAIIRRQIRHALINGLGGSIACLVAATIIAGNPTRWVSMPNQVATYGQALVVDALAGHSSSSKAGLCATNVGGIKGKVSPGFGASAQRKLEKVGKNMQSEIGCKMWQVFILRPFVQGQYGTTYSKLSAHKIHNHNTKWTGKPVVPIGGGKFRDNWALFQISAQTNAHSQLGNNGKYADDPAKNQVSTIDGTGRDWYRIVDAFSNYDEKSSGNQTQTGQNGAQELTDQITTLKPSKYWQAWVGNKSTDRYGVALLSVFFAVIGSLGPLLFGALAAIYGVGVSLLMAVSPIFLLFGMWAGSGTEIMKGWASSLLSVLVKKIVAAGLIIISFDVTMACMDLVDKIGWIKAVILTVIMSSVMIKSRSKIFDIFATFNFGNAFNPLTPFVSMAKKTRHAARSGAVGALAIAEGAHQAHRLGLSRGQGIKIATGQQVKMHLRRSTFGRAALNMNEEYGVVPPHDIYCTVCGRRLGEGEHAWRDENGNFYCDDCANDMDDNMELMETILPGKGESRGNERRGYRERVRDLKHQRLLPKDMDINNVANYKAAQNIHMNDMPLANQKSWLSYTGLYRQINLHRRTDGTFDFDHSKLIATVNKEINALDKDLDEYAKMYKEHGNRVQPPAIPEPLHPYLNQTVIHEAFREGLHDQVKNAYKSAWVQYYDDNTRQLGQADKARRNEFIDGIHADKDLKKPDDNSDNNDNNGPQNPKSHKFNPFKRGNKDDKSSSSQHQSNSDGSTDDKSSFDKLHKDDSTAEDPKKSDDDGDDDDPQNPFTNK